MSALPVPLPRPTRRAAFGQVVLNEARVSWRRPQGQDSVQGQFPPAMPLLVLTAYAVVFGYLAQRWFRWE